MYPACATPPVKGMNCKMLWLYRVPSSFVWCSWVIKESNLSFTGVESLCGKILQMLSPVFLITQTYFPLELFCRTPKDTWFIPEYFLWVVSYKVNGAITRKVTFFSPTLHCVDCSLFSLFLVLPVLQDLCAKIKWCCLGVVLYRDLCHLPFLVVRSWCGRMHLGFVFWDS